MTRGVHVPVLALALGLGCSGAGGGAARSPASGAAEPGARAQDRSGGAPAEGPAPLELPPPAEGPAPWLDRRDPPKRDALGVASDVRWGERAALVRTWAGWYAVHRDRGAVGPLSLPSDADWVGIAGDEVLVADKGGELFAAPPEDALPGEEGLSRRGAVPGAAAWDAAGDVVVAGASWDEVFISTDAGRSFRAASVGEGLVVAEVYARADGAVAARARPLEEPEAALVTYVAPRGRRFERSRFQPERVYRTGSWIWAGADCPVVLAADGVHWIARDVYALADEDLWSDMLDRVYQVRALPPVDLLSAAVPAPPRYDRDRDGAGEGRCEPAGEPDEEREIEESAGGITLEQCRGLYCLGAIWPGEPLRGSSPVALLSDGRCARAKDAGKDGWCGPGAALSRAPQAVERDDPRPIELPEGCAPHHVLNGPGLGLLFCADGGGTRVWALADRRWREEGRLAAPPEEVRKLLAAEDGTLLVGRACERAGERCRVFVRRPLAAGAGGAWRELAVERALAYRPVPGGRALAVARAGAGARTRVRISLHGPSGTPEVLAEAAEAPGDASGVRVAGEAVVFLAGSRLEPVRHVLVPGGRLIRR